MALFFVIRIFLLYYSIFSVRFQCFLSKIHCRIVLLYIDFCKKAADRILSAALYAGRFSAMHCWWKKENKNDGYPSFFIDRIFRL